MDVRDYCDSLVSELTGWRSKMYDVIRRLEKVPSGDKAKVLPYVNDLIPFRDYDCNPGRWSPAVSGYASDIQGKSDTLRHDSNGETPLPLRASPIVDPGSLLVKWRSGINMVFEELTNRIARLRHECPTEWDPDKIEIGGALGQIRSKWDDLWARLPKTSERV